VVSSEQADLAIALSARYRLSRLLGVGGMATVYLATDLRYEREVAVKVLKPELAVAVGTQRFLLEMRVTAQLTHPHILPLFDSGDAAGRLWFATPYISGESLRMRLDREAQLPIQDALDITRDVADALDYAHSRGVLHRDIKPENILLTGNHALVADFGVARAIGALEQDRLTRTGVPVGTVLYMSPEQAACEANVGPRSDLYALACVLYEMLAGEAPWRGPTVQTTMARRLAQPLTPVRLARPTVPPHIDAVLGRALASVPADRFASGAAFAEALKASDAYRTDSSEFESPLFGQYGAISDDLKLRLRRRAVRIGVTYLVVAAFVVQAVNLIVDAFGLPEWVYPLVLVLSILGFPLTIAVGFAMAARHSPIGIIKRLVIRLRGPIAWLNNRRREEREAVALLEAKVRILEEERDFYRAMAESHTKHSSEAQHSPDQLRGSMPRASVVHEAGGTSSNGR
jgi:hypothetical protein